MRGVVSSALCFEHPEARRHAHLLKTVSGWIPSNSLRHRGVGPNHLHLCVKEGGDRFNRRCLNPTDFAHGLLLMLRSRPHP